MDSSKENSYINFHEAAEVLNLNQLQLLNVLISGKLKAYHWERMVKEWDLIAEEALIDAKSRNDGTLHLIVCGDKPNHFHDYEKDTSFDQISLLKTKVEEYKRYLPQELVILKKDCSEISFGGDLFKLQAHQAEIIEFLYKRSQTSCPEVREKDIFDHCPLASTKSEHRLTKVFRDKNKDLFDRIVVKTGVATYKLAPFSE